MIQIIGCKDHRNKRSRAPSLLFRYELFGHLERLQSISPPLFLTIPLLLLASCGGSSSGCVYQRSLPPIPRECCHPDRTKLPPTRSVATQGFVLLFVGGASQLGFGFS